MTCHLEAFTTSPLAGEIRPARPERAWMDAFRDRHAYRCLPLAIANTFGWEILAPITVEARYTGGPERSDLVVSSPDAAAPMLEHVAQSNFSRGILTFHTGYLFRTPPGWQLLATGPFNEPQDGFWPLTGIIETDWLPYPFTMNWQLTRPGLYRFAKGEPICHVLPVRIADLQAATVDVYTLEQDPVLKREQDRFAEFRRQFRARMDAGDPEALRQAWQRLYFTGRRSPDNGDTEPTHVHKLRLREPVDHRAEGPLALAETERRRGMGDATVRPCAGPQHAIREAIASEAAKASLGAIAAAPEAVAAHPPRARLPAGIRHTLDLPTETHLPGVEGRGVRQLNCLVVDSQADTSDILIQPGFLSPAQCRALVAAFEANAGQTNPTPDVFFAGRVLWQHRISPAQVDAHRIMQQARLVACHHVGRFFAHPRPLYDDAPQLVRWPAGYAMPLHADNQHPDGTPNPSPHRLYAAVVYLNDDYDGGLLVLDRLGLAVQPATGLLVGFRGGAEHTHAVTRVTDGVRYTMPMWFTDDAAKSDPRVMRVW